jgi:hypothetical protein
MSQTTDDSAKLEAIAESPGDFSKETPFQPLKGLKLATLLGSITLVIFLALLDTSIIGTVRLSSFESRYLF